VIPKTTEMLKRLLVFVFALAALSVVNMGSRTAAQATTPADTNKDLVRRYHQAYISGDTAALAQIVTADYHSHNASPILPPGLAGVQAQAAQFHAAFPDAKSTVDQLVAEADLVTISYSTSGTQKGDYQGVTATNVPMTFSGIDLYRVKDGKIVEGWDQGDALSLAKQLHAPYPAKTDVHTLPASAVKQVAALTPGSFMEGIAADAKGDLFISDSNLFTGSRAITGSVAKIRWFWKRVGLSSGIRKVRQRCQTGD